jgi:hypothetical protein
MAIKFLGCTVFLLSVSLSASCADSAPEVPLAQGPAGAPEIFPFEVYRQADARGEIVYEIDPVASTAVVRVSRAGFLALLGHDHLVASHNITGYALLPDQAGTMSGARADLYLPLAGLTVDEAELLEAAGVDTRPSAKDIDGTRANMLKSLDAATYPWLTVSVLMISETALFANVDLHGVRRGYRIPVDIQFDAEALKVMGEFRLRQTDHGIQPFRALAGAMSVGDELAVSFTLIARL